MFLKMAYTSPRMNEDEVYSVKLVQEVEKHPFLYNFKLKDYFKRDETEKSWEKVGKAMNDTAANCKEKWRNIRTVYNRKLKLPPSCSAKKKKYYLMDYLDFLMPFIGSKPARELCANLPSPPDSAERVEQDMEQNEKVDEVNTEDTPVEEEGSQEPPKKKLITKKHIRQISTVNDAFIKYLEKKSEEPKEMNPRRMFLLSLVPEVDKLSEQKMRKFRRSVLLTLDSLLDEESTCASSVNSSYSRPSSVSPNVPRTPDTAYTFDETNSKDYYQNFNGQQIQDFNAPQNLTAL